MADKTTAYVAAGVLGVAGVGLVLLGLGKKGGAPVPGEWSPPYVPGQATGATIEIHTGGTVHVLAPKIKYRGPATQVFTYLQVKQAYQGQEVSVMGSGVAGVSIGPADTLTEFDLVSPTQPEPPGEPAQSLMAGQWPGLRDAAGNIPTPICGKPADPTQPGKMYLEVYAKGDGDGFSAPTCNKRVLIMASSWPVKFI